MISSIASYYPNPIYTKVKFLITDLKKTWVSIIFRKQTSGFLELLDQPFPSAQQQQPQIFLQKSGG